MVKSENIMVKTASDFMLLINTVIKQTHSYFTPFAALVIDFIFNEYIKLSSSAGI